jgi:hypothetical protein
MDPVTAITGDVGKAVIEIDGDENIVERHRPRSALYDQPTRSSVCNQHGPSLFLLGPPARRTPYAGLC